MKQFVTQGAKRFGYEIIPCWRTERLGFARHLAKLFDHLKIDCVLDVGANKGQYRDFIRMEVGFDGPIISFEPVRSTFQILAERARGDHNWEVKNCALGEHDGDMEINVMASSSLTSFLKPDQNHLSLENNVIVDKETVVIRRLDTLARELDLIASNNCYLKMDTQGYDMQVCNGGGEFLKRVKALQSEMSVIPIYHGMPDYMKSIQHLESLGYALSNMFPVRLGNDLELVEFDCVMVRQPQLTAAQ